MNSEERIRYLIEVLGQKESEKAFKDQAKVIHESGKAYNQHSEALRNNAKTQQLAEQAAARQTVAQLKLAQQFGVTARAAQQAGQGGLDFSTKAQRAAISLGSLTTAATGLAPSLTGAGAAISRASGVIGAMTQLVSGGVSGSGAGVAGVIAGTAVAAIGLLSATFKTNAERAKEAATAMSEYVAELKAMNDAALEAYNSSPIGVARAVEAGRQAAEQRRRGLVDSGFFSGRDEDREAYLERTAPQRDKLNEQLSDVQGRIKDAASAVRSSGLKKQEAEIRARLRALDEGAPAAATQAQLGLSPVSYGMGVDFGTDESGTPYKSEEDAAVAIDAARRKLIADAQTKKKGSKPTGIPYVNYEDAAGSVRYAPKRDVDLGVDPEAARAGRAQMDVLLREEEMSKRRMAALDKLKAGAGFEFNEEAIASTGAEAGIKAEEQMRVESAQRMRELAELDVEQERDRWARKEAMVTQYHDTLREQGKQAYDMMAGAVAGFFGKMAAGQKTSLKEFLKALGVQAVQQGTFNMLQALFMLANPLTSAAGAAMMPPALLMMAMGGGAAAAGSGGGGGGGGGSASRNHPLLMPASTESGGRVQPMTVNENHFHMSSTLTPTDRDATAIEEAQAEKRRHGL